MSVLWGYIFSALYVTLCVTVGLVAHRLGLPRPYCRKIVHVTVGFEWWILYYFFGAGIRTLAVCLFFFFTLFVAYRFGIFSSFMGSSGDNAPGTVYYAAAMSVMALISCFSPDFMFPFGAAVLCTSLGDGAAGIVGRAVRRRNPKIRGEKTLLGATAMFLISFIAVFFFSSASGLSVFWYDALAVATLATGVELLSSQGTDNITVPLSVSALVYAILTFSAMRGYFLPLVLTPLILVIVGARPVLTRSGIIAALMLDVSVGVFLGNRGFLLLLTFFAVGCLTDAVRKKKKQVLLSDMEEKGHCRDWVQVLANGGVAAVFAVLAGLTGSGVFLLFFVAALAEALGDTAASGIGVLSRRVYDVFHFRRCEPGISGGMSLSGTVAAILGASLIAVLGKLLFGFLWHWCGVAAFCGFLGTVADSLCGSLWQLKFRCTVCGKETERHTHCDTPTERIGGVIPFDNDFVNFIGTISAVLLTFVVVVFFRVIK